LSLEENAEPELILGTEADERLPALSPNGRFLSYSSDESGTPQVYIRPFPTGTEKWQVSTRHGWLSYWSPSGDRLYYHDYDRLMVVQVSTDPVLRLGTPRLFLDPSHTTILPWEGIDIAEDGKRLVGIRNVKKDDNDEDKVEEGIHVVLNWFSDFEE